MPSRSFYFLRHGETDWNIEGRLQGHTDIPLNATGRSQAEKSILALKEAVLHRIIASPLSRAYETAEIVNRILNLPVETDERLREKHFGLYEGKTSVDIEAYHKIHPKTELSVEPETGNTRPPGGESYAHFHTRIIAGIKDSLERYPGENILFVSHGGVYRVLCRFFFGNTDQSPNAQPFHFYRNGDEWSLIKIG